MAATELSATTTARRHAHAGGLAVMIARVYALLWVVTLAAAAATASLGLTDAVRGLLRLSLSGDTTPGPSPRVFAVVALHNLPVCGWPLLLPAAGAYRSRRCKFAATGLVAGAVTANAALVGAALGAYGTRLLPYVPQLPLEWLALAGGAAGWAAQRSASDRRARTLAAGVVVAAVLAAAALESYAVPHGRDAHPAAPRVNPQGGQHRRRTDKYMQGHG